MFKKMVALVLTLVLCMSVVQLAYATNCPNHEYVAQKTGRTAIMPISITQHKQHLEYIYVCKLCGATAGPTYIPDNQATPSEHILGGWTGYHVSANNTHVFYRPCTICRYEAEKTILQCPGGLGHVEHP